MQAPSEAPRSVQTEAMAIDRSHQTHTVSLFQSEDQQT